MPRVATARCLLLVFGASLFVALLVWISRAPEPAVEGAFPGAVADEPTGPALRIALIPERDIYIQRRRYKLLMGHLSSELDRPIQLVTLSSYAAVLDQLAEQKIDGAFLGSMVTVLAHERLGARVLVKPEQEDGSSTYHGVIFVREDSPIQTIGDLAGRSLAMVHTTTACALFPFYLLTQHDMMEGRDAPKPVWVGTHDDVVAEVVAGRVDAGAAKNPRVDHYLRTHPEAELRRLAESDQVPENALVVAAHLPSSLSRRLEAALLELHRTRAGRDVLARFGSARFRRCTIADYSAVYEMMKPLSPEYLRICTGEVASSRSSGRSDPGMQEER